MVKSRLFWAISYGVIGLLAGFILVYPVRAIIENQMLQVEMQELNELKALGIGESLAENNITDDDQKVFRPHVVYSDRYDDKAIGPIFIDEEKENLIEQAIALINDEEQKEQIAPGIIISDDLYGHLGEEKELPKEINKQLVMLPQYFYLYEKNPDFIGWLTINDFNVDYPVMQTDESRKWYYLDHDFEKNVNKNGSLFIDERCDIGSGVSSNFYKDGTFPSTNIIIYGHSMANGTMFGHLQDYLKQDFANKHNVICFDTLYEERKYMVVAALRTHVLNSEEEGFRYYDFVNATNKDEFKAFKDFIDRNNVIKSDRDFGLGDEFLTLSTCHKYDENEKTNENARVVVIAVRIE